MAKRPRKTRTTILATVGVFVCAVAIPWGPQLMGCELDTSPIRQPVNKPELRDDADSGEELVS